MQISNSFPTSSSCECWFSSSMSSPSSSEPSRPLNAGVPVSRRTRRRRRRVAVVVEQRGDCASVRLDGLTLSLSRGSRIAEAVVRVYLARRVRGSRKTFFSVATGAASLRGAGPLAPTPRAGNRACLAPRRTLRAAVAPPRRALCPAPAPALATISAFRAGGHRACLPPRGWSARCAARRSETQGTRFRRCRCGARGFARGRTRTRARAAGRRRARE